MSATVQDKPASLVPDGLLTPFRSKDFRWLISGQLLSTFGDMLFIVALPFVVLAEGGVGDLSLMLMVLGFARIAGAPVGGMLADRWDPRRVMLFADVARAGVLFLLVQVITADLPMFGPLTVGLGLLGVLDGLFVPAYWAMTPTVLPKEQVAAGNAVGEAAMIIAVMVGPLVAGFAMATTSPEVVIGLNALTFVVAAGTLLLVRTNPEHASSEATSREPSDRGALLAFARGSGLFVAMLVMTAALHLTSAGVVSVALPVYSDQFFADGERMYGLLLGAQGAGLLVGTLAAGVTGRLRRRGYLAVALLAVHGVALIVFGSGPGTVWLLLLLMVTIGLVSGMLSIIVITLLQQIARPELRGRVMGAFTSVTIGSYPISVILVGFVVGRWNVESAFVLGGLGVLAVAAFGLLRRAVREI